MDELLNHMFMDEDHMFMDEATNWFNDTQAFHPITMTTKLQWYNGIMDDLLTDLRRKVKVLFEFVIIDIGYQMHILGL